MLEQEPHRKEPALPDETKEAVVEILQVDLPNEVKAEKKSEPHRINWDSSLWKVILFNIHLFRQLPPKLQRELLKASVLLGITITAKTITSRFSRQKK